jgi:hypothetical protein
MNHGCDQKCGVGNGGRESGSVVGREAVTKTRSSNIAIQNKHEVRIAKADSPGAWQGAHPGHGLSADLRWLPRGCGALARLT